MSRKATPNNKAARFLKEKLGDAKRELRVEQELNVILRRENEGIRQELLASNSYAIELLRELQKRGFQGDNATADAPIHVSDRENAVTGRKSGNNSISVATIKAALGDWQKYSGLDGPELESPAYLRGCSEYQGPEGVLC